MDNVTKILLTAIGLFLGIFGLLFPTVAAYLFLTMLNLLLYVILTNVAEGRITNVIGSLLIISVILTIAELIIELILAIPLNLTLLKVSGGISTLSLVLFLLYYIYSFIKGTLESIEIKLKK